MAFPDDSADVYPYPPIDWKFDVYPDLDLQLTAGGTGISESSGPLADHWGMSELPDSMLYPWVGGPVSSNDDLVARNFTNGHPPLSYPYPSQDFPGIQVHPQLAGFSGWNDSFPATAAQETPTFAPGPSDVLFGYLGDNQSRTAVSTFHANVNPVDNSMPGPARAEPTRTQRFQPYGRYHTRGTDHVLMEAGPSTRPHLCNQSVSLPTTQPPGGTSEKKCGAGPSQPNKEEDETLKAGQTRPVPAQGNPHTYRIRMEGDISALLQWAQGRKGLAKFPSRNQALAAAVEVIRTIHGVVNQEPLLSITKTKNNRATGKIQTERDRRTVERGLYKELSRYYPRAEGLWTQPKLLSEVMRDLEAHPNL